jgi:hypothetical protein
MGLLRNLLAPFANAAISSRLTSIEERLAEIELGWAETLDKLSAWAKRQSKRERDAANKALDVQPDLLGSARTDDLAGRKQLLRQKLSTLRGTRREA